MKAYRFGPFLLDAGAHLFCRDLLPHPLQEQPFQVLLALVEHPGRLVSRETLRLRLWGTHTFVDFDQSLNSAVRRLRAALHDNPRRPTYIETVPRLGFRFLAEVSVEPGAAPLTGALTAKPSRLGARPPAAGPPPNASLSAKALHPIACP